MPSLLLQKPSKNSKAKNLKSSCVGKKNETLAKRWFNGTITLDKVFKSGLSKFCERQPLKNLKRYGLLKQMISLQIF